MLQRRLHVRLGDNFDTLATSDDGSCDRLGCMSEWADNFDTQLLLMMEAVIV